MNKFLDDNPDLKQEFNSFENIKLEPISVEYKNKENLIKETQATLFEITNFEYLAVAELENDISDEEKNELNKLLNKNKNLNSELNLFRRTKLDNNTFVKFPLKNQLKKREVYGYTKIVTYTAAAAIIALFLILNINKKTNSKLQIASILTHHNSKIKELKIIKPDKKSNNKKQRFFTSHKQTNNKLTNNKIFAFDDNESQKNVDIYKELSVSIPDLKTETLIFEKNNSEIGNTYNDITFADEKLQEKDKLWQYAEKSVKIWKLISSSDMEMNNKYKTNGNIEKLNVYASNIRFSKTFNR